MEEKHVTAYVKKLAACNAESDTLAVTLEAFKKGFISKKVLDDLTSLHPQVSISERRRALLMHVHTTLQEKIKEFEVRFSMIPAYNAESETVALAVQAVREGLIEKECAGPPHLPPHSGTLFNETQVLYCQHMCATLNEKLKRI